MDSFYSSDEAVKREAKKPLYSSGEEKGIKTGNFHALLTHVIERETDKPHHEMLLKEVSLVFAVLSNVLNILLI